MVGVERESDALVADHVQEFIATRLLGRVDEHSVLRR
jgi:hypothetical protein